MEIYRSELENSILIIANNCGLYDNYKTLLEKQPNLLTAICREIIIEMFIKEFDKNRCHPSEEEAYAHILNYLQEQKVRGVVNFK